VLTVKIFEYRDECPSTLPAVCAQVSGVRMPGQLPRVRQVQTRANDIPTDKQNVDGVSGAPPRGRPV
jgi:hypothetical protein